MIAADWLPQFTLYLRSRYRALTLVIGRAWEGHLVLREFLIAEWARGRGLGTQVLRELLAAADQHNDTMVLCPASWGPDPARLIRWFERMGFVRSRQCVGNAGVPHTMRRRPAGPGRLLQTHPEPEPAPPYAGRTRVLPLGDGAPIRVPGAVAQVWPDAHALQLLQTLRGFGLEPRIDWAHGTRRGSVRLLVGDPDTDTHGDVVIGVRSGHVLRGYLTMPGRTHGLAEFRSAGNWAAVLATHRELVQSHGQRATHPDRGIRGPA